MTELRIARLRLAAGQSRQAKAALLALRREARIEIAADDELMLEIEQILARLGLSLDE